MPKTHKFKLAALGLATVATLLTAPVFAGVPEGRAALKDGDYETAMDEFRAVATKPGATLRQVAQHELGLMYLKGQGGPADAERGAMWIERAAQTWYPPAMNTLGMLHRLGLGGVEKNPRTAMRLFMQASISDAAAQYNLAVMPGQSGIRKDDIVFKHALISLALINGLDEKINKTPEQYAAEMTPAQLQESRALLKALQVPGNYYRALNGYLLMH